MHQSFDDYAEQDAQRILFQEDSHIGDRDTTRFAYKVQAVDRMVQMMREGKVILVGDTFHDVPQGTIAHTPFTVQLDSYKVAHDQTYPEVGEVHVTPAKPVFDFDEYNSLGSLPRIK